MSDDAAYQVIAGGLIALILAYAKEPSATHPVRALGQVFVSASLLGGLVATLVAAKSTDPGLFAGSAVLVLGIAYYLLPKALSAATTATVGIAGPTALVVLSVLMSGVALATAYGVTARALLVALGAELLVLGLAFTWAERQDRPPWDRAVDRAVSMIGGAALIMYFESAVLLRWAAEQEDAQTKALLTGIDVVLALLAFALLWRGVRRWRQLLDRADKKGDD